MLGVLYELPKVKFHGAMAGFVHVSPYQSIKAIGIAADQLHRVFEKHKTDVVSQVQRFTSNSVHTAFVSNIALILPRTFE